MKVAQSGYNIDGIQWATAGILSQAWTKNEAQVWKSGLVAANVTLQKLRAGRDTKEKAKEFEAALNEAVERDVFVRVRWTGGADIDILVEEPSGSICSLRCARTSGGGVMLGDGFSHVGDDGSKAYEEVYVCPKGFDGTYRVLVRRVWGKVTAGKVNVEVIKHYRGRNAERIAKMVTLKKDEALVVFDLEEGRRTEPLEKHQLANAAKTQIAFSRQVLSQQLAAAEDNKTSNSTAGRFPASPNRGRPGFRKGSPGGYQPVIITLPEGANLAATAVVSADRRYVRITTVPLFSGVSEVNVFNTATGQSEEGRGGTGGRGYSDIFGDSNQDTQQDPNP